MSKTSIEWTQETWNPTVGCDRISPGCANCYAKTLHDKRHKAVDGAKLPVQYLKPFETLQLMDDRLDVPLRRRKPTTYFVNSVSDLFHEDVPDAFIDRVFAVMALAPDHTFQILTKRAQRMRDYALRLEGRLGELWDLTNQPTWITLPAGRSFPRYPENWPLPNVWLGVSAENQHFADERIPLLLQTPAAIRFVSAEPLLGQVNLDNGDTSWLSCTPKTREREGADCCMANLEGHPHFRGLDWVIVGVESGAGRRNQDAYEEHARSLLGQCAAAGVARFHKQMPIRGRISHDPAEWAEDLRVREFPGDARVANR